jgi:hypothetical protein
MTELNQDQGIPVAKLLEIIGKQTVEWLVNEEAVTKFKEQAEAIAKRNVDLTNEVSALKGKGAELAPVSPELAQLRTINTANDAHILQMEQDLHKVALERDAAKAEAQGMRERLTDLQFRFNELQESVKAPVVEVPVVEIPKKPKRK